MKWEMWNIYIRNSKTKMAGAEWHKESPCQQSAVLPCVGTGKQRHAAQVSGRYSVAWT